MFRSLRPDTYAVPALRQAACLATLSADLLRGVFALVWACRPAWPAAQEVRHAVSLFSVCRCVREVLKARPLPLVLDFTASLLSQKQRAWLAAPVCVGYIEGVSFHSGEKGLWRRRQAYGRTFYSKFLDQHGRSLLRLSGVPLRLLSSLSPWMQPALDLSGLGLTHLGVLCTWGRLRLGPERRILLGPGFWPQSLVQLRLLEVNGAWSNLLPHIDWGTDPRFRPDVRLPAAAGHHGDGVR